jgi:hypothetical protein
VLVMSRMISMDDDIVWLHIMARSTNCTEGTKYPAYRGDKKKEALEMKEEKAQARGVVLSTKNFLPHKIF